MSAMTARIRAEQDSADLTAAIRAISPERLDGLKWPVFDLGEVAIAPHARAELSDADIAAGVFLHGCCLWGELESEDWIANDMALVNRFPVLSMFSAINGTTYYVATDFDRCRTEIVLAPEL